MPTALFDLWLGLTVLQVDPAEILDCLAPYRTDGFTARRAILNLEAKLGDDVFCRDLDPLVSTRPEGYSVQDAGELIVETLLSRL